MGAGRPPSRKKRSSVCPELPVQKLPDLGVQEVQGLLGAEGDGVARQGEVGKVAVMAPDIPHRQAGDAGKALKDGNVSVLLLDALGVPGGVDPVPVELAAAQQPPVGAVGVKHALLRVAVPEELLLLLRRQGDAHAPQHRHLLVLGDGLVVAHRRAVLDGPQELPLGPLIEEDPGGDHKKDNEENGHRLASNFFSSRWNSSGRGQVSSTVSPVRGWTKRSPTA